MKQILQKQSNFWIRRDNQRPGNAKPEKTFSDWLRKVPFLLLLVCLLAQSGLSQSMVMLAGMPVQTQTPAEVDTKKPLIKLLSELTAKYQINFDFEKKMLEGKFVGKEYSVTDVKDLEAFLNEVLTPLKLTFEKLDGNYLIYPERKNRESKKKKTKQKSNEGKKTNGTFRDNIEVAQLPNLFPNITQELLIRGKVTDENSQPLPGANIIVKGTTIGTVADNEGNYQLQVPDEATTLVFSYIGYLKEEVDINGQTVIDIALTSDLTQLEEIIVVGYGTLQKSDIVGSVASVDLAEATAIPTTNVSEMLRGRAAGVQINLADARPGGSSNILIRGKVSLVGNDPLIIVDGVPYDDINDVAPEDIASIEVLKDASSQAIYGARAANGVILITTKRGKEGKIAINYHGYTTTQRLTKNFDLYNGEEFAQLRREANRDRTTGEFLDDATIFGDFELEAIANRNFVDWEDLILENATIQSHSLSISGGTESTKVYSSVSYFNQDGLIPGSGFERGTFKLNIDQKINEKLSFQANINFQRSIQDIESNSLDFITISPLAKPFDENGDLVKEPLGTGNTTINPLWNIRESINEVKTNLKDINLTGTYNLTPVLSYKLNTFLRNRDGQQGIYRSSLHSNGDQGVDGLATLSTKFFKEFLLENIVNYSPQINEANKLDFTFVHALSERRTTETTINKSGFPNDDLGFNGTATELLSNKRDVNSRRLVSFLGRVRYNLLDKYLFTFTARADGSSVFAENNKWGFFPAAAFAWKMHEEPFLKNSSSINEMKFRVSYGATGNEGINSKESLGVADDLPYVFGGVTNGGFAASSRLPNPNLKWETTNTFNVGVDFGLFNNLFTGTFEFYKANTVDFLLDRILPGTTGFSVTRFNVGEVENKGFEATLNTNIIKKEDLQWSVGLSFSSNDNQVVALTGELDDDGNPLELTFVDDNFQTQHLAIGEPINNIFQRQFDGILQEGDDIANSAQPNATPGDVRVVDINGDGEITDDDNVFISEDPDWYGSITTTVNYKGFELFVDFYIVEGPRKLNPFLANGEPLKGAINGIKIPFYTPENPSADYPRPRNDTAANLFPFAVRDASYSRLRTLTLAYEIPERVISKIGLINAKIYGTATNLFTITDYKSYSPEQNPNAFPDAKGMTFGIKLGF